ncbi:hypothetical protein [Nonlabens agnitus]|uniref:Glycosyltransferase RgtA/B/C/D-like domain-containing protein n=1 Tax=Nonlabens agnitus TaxID=870484 RepID=A0A2S9WVK4_9FLAO|nr:hypothetical protein [Nonlabens agnitus]PRP67517.1 hypothetical protein BST86_10650 [Nonlabens agnitus]
MIKYLSFAVLIFINCLFCYKYSERYTDQYELLTLFYLIGQITIIVFINKITAFKTCQSIVINTLIIIPFFLALLSYVYISPEQLNVDRWSVINSFLTNLLNGRYPYSAISHVGNPPGPMPIYFLIALPFDFFKAYSLLSALGFIALGFFYKRFYCETYNSSYLILTIISIFMLWEIFSLSNIISFSVLVAIALLYFEKSIMKPEKRMILIVVALGLLLSTRSVYSLAYIVFFLSLIKTSSMTFLKASFLATMILAVFTLTFLPFIIFFPNEFYEINPFIIQSSFLLPAHFVPILFIIAIGFGIFAKNLSERFIYAGFTLFLSIFFYSGYMVTQHGYSNAIFESKIDVSYFLFCIPFLFIGVLEHTKHNSLLTTTSDS